MQLIDSDGNPIQLGHHIGKGGEGNVYEVEGDPSQVAKVYHQSPLTEDQFCKLESMVARRTASLRKVAAWPEAILRYRNGNEPCGLLMPKVDKSRQLHELYGTTNRHLHFPEVRWHHLLLAARNLAAAFHTLHDQGIVMGDVNQGNLMVDSNYHIRFIDCDSFQIIDGEKTYYCPVGTPHFTPPELQSKKLGRVVRTVDHDQFGLAVLIFHLVFVGRHPFAGRFRGEGDLLIEEAIAERRFAFSRDKDVTMVEPPPYSLQLDDLPQGLADLFEAAFRVGGAIGSVDGDAVDGDTADGRGFDRLRVNGNNFNGAGRPTPEQWAVQLDAVMSHREVCELDDFHIYYSGLKTCPWCRIEDEGGPTFFVKDGGSSIISGGRLEMLDAKINALRPISFPDLLPSQTTPPEKVSLKKTGDKVKIRLPDGAALLLVVAALLCFGGIVSSIWWLVAGSLLALGAGACLLFAPQCKARRQAVQELDTQLNKLRSRMLHCARTVGGKHQHRKKQFDANMAELRATVKRYCSEDDKIKDVLRDQAGAAKNDFLRGHLLRDHIAEIPGLTASTIPMLESYGVETALDVHKLGVYGVPIMSPALALEMLQWRELVERKFVFKPAHGVTAADMARAQQAATQRFKIAQARKILIGARHLDSLAMVGKATLKRSARDFDTLSSRWKEVAREKGNYQLSRTKLERTINSSPAAIIAVALAIPIVGGLVSWIAGQF